jgi:sulfonate transport system substrate-binding protein
MRSSSRAIATVCEGDRILLQRWLATASKAMLALAAIFPVAGHAAEAIPPGTILKMGDQKGGSQALLEAAGALDGLPYRLEWKQFAAAAPLLEALNAGAVDGAFAGDAPTTFALAAGLPGKIIAVNRSPGQGTAIVAAKGSPIRTVEDLKGKRIGTGKGSIGHYLVLAFLQRQQWKPDEVALAFLQPADAKAALSAGAVDAWAAWSTYVAQATLGEGGSVVVDGRGLISGLTFQVATDEAIATKRTALADYVRRLAQARRWALDHVDEYATRWAAEIGVSVDVAALAYRQDAAVPVPVDAQVIADEQHTADVYAGAHVIARRLDVGTSFDASFNDALRQ